VFCFAASQPSTENPPENTILIIGVDVGTVLNLKSDKIPAIYSSTNQWIAEMGSVKRVVGAINMFGVVIEFENSIPSETLASVNRPSSSTALTLW
jgi:hypothetical protein